MLTLKTQIWEKPRQPSDYKISLCEDYNAGARRQRPLATLLRQQAVTTEATTSSSLSLTLYTFTHSKLYHANNYSVCSYTHSYVKFAVGHIYTNMTFGLFTNIALVGSQEHIYIYVPSIRGEVLTGPATSGSSHFSFGGTCFPTSSWRSRPWSTFSACNAYSVMSVTLRIRSCYIGPVLPNI